MSAIQIVKIDESILQYFFEEMGMQNESEQYRQVKLNEFKRELTKALNTGVGTKEIKWIR